MMFKLYRDITRPEAEYSNFAEFEVIEHSVKLSPYFLIAQ